MLSDILKKQREEFEKERTDAISEMFDNPEGGIYPTSKFFKRLDRFVVNLQSELLSAVIEEIEGRKKTKTYPQQLHTFKGEVEYFDRLSDGDIHYNQALSELVEKLKEALK